MAGKSVFVKNTLSVEVHFLEGANEVVDQIYSPHWVCIELVDNFETANFLMHRVHVGDILCRDNAQEGFAKVKFRAQRANQIESLPVLKLIADNIGKCTVFTAFAIKFQCRNEFVGVSQFLDNFR
jgi:hypothetical protein